MSSAVCGELGPGASGADAPGSVAPALRLARAMQDRVAERDWAGAGAVEAELGAWLARYFQSYGGLDQAHSSEARDALRQVVEIYRECLDVLCESRQGLAAELEALPRRRRQLGDYLGAAER